MSETPFRTRFAPSPTGPLHLGHAYSAILGHDMARARGGAFLLRIEDIDHTRCRPHWEHEIYEDLEWLGLSWDGVLRQSDRTEAYQEALQRLWDRGLIYPCKCKRRDILAAVSAPQEGDPPLGPDGVIYPGTCRAKPRPKEIPKETVLRLDINAACRALGVQRELTFDETGYTQNIPSVVKMPLDQLDTAVGDIVLSRRDFPASYHLSVVLDDAAQSISDVVRGKDLFDATIIHVLLQRLLDIDTPVYHHHKLIRDERGRRLAKRDNARSISTLRRDGATPYGIRRQLGL